MRRQSLVSFDLRERAGSLSHQSDDVSGGVPQNSNVLDSTTSDLPKGRDRAPVILHMAGTTYTAYEATGEAIPRPGKLVSKSILKFLERIRPPKEALDNEQVKTAYLIVESFVWPFLSRRLHSGHLDDVTWSNWILDFRHMLDVLQKLTVDEQITVCKFHCDTAMWKVVGDRNPPPETPKGALSEVKIFTGSIHKELARRIVKRDVSFIYSLQKGSKSSWPEVTDEKVRKTLQDHYKVLCGPPAQSGLEPWLPIHDGIDSILESQSSITLARELFGRPKVHREREILVPSGSACAETPRALGGALAYYGYHLIEFPDATSSLRANVNQMAGVQEQLKERAYALQHRTVHETILPDHYLTLFEHEELKAFEKDFRRWEELGGPLNPERRRRPGSISELRVSRVSAIKEPGKVRTVTVGSADRGLALLSLQGNLLDAWKASRYSTMRDEDLTERVSSLIENTPDDWLIYSVDYKSATDLLYREVTEGILQLIRRQARGYGSMALDCAIADAQQGDLLIYPKEAFKGCDGYEDITRSSQYILRNYLMKCEYSKGCTDQFRVPGINDFPELSPRKAMAQIQKLINKYYIVGVKQRGQLMGHWLSFPLLCFANLSAILFAATQHSDKLYQKLRHNILVNGDDVMFRAPRDFYPILERITKRFGFAFSVGKNYMSPFFGQMNSQAFVLTQKAYVPLNILDGIERADQKRMRVVKRIGYVPMKLLTGVSPKTGVSLADPLAVAKDVGRMLDQVPWSTAVAYEVLKARVSNKLTLRRGSKPVTPGWFIPIQAGGLGINREYSHLVGSHNRLTLAQRKMAAWFRSNQKIPKLLEATFADTTFKEQAVAMLKFAMELKKAQEKGPEGTRAVYDKLGDYLDKRGVKPSKFSNHTDFIEYTGADGEFRGSARLNSTSNHLITDRLVMLGEGPLPEGYSWGDRKSAGNLTSDIGIESSLAFYFTRDMLDFIRGTGELSELVPSNKTASRVMFRVAFTGSVQIRPMSVEAINALSHLRFFERLPFGTNPLSFKYTDGEWVSSFRPGVPSTPLRGVDIPIAFGSREYGHELTLLMRENPNLRILPNSVGVPSRRKKSSPREDAQEK